MKDFSTPDLFDENQQIVKVMSYGLQHYGNKRMFAGQVTTVNCPDDNSYVLKILEQEGLGKVLLINAFASKKFAFLGDQLAELAIKNNWQGIVVNGCVRDVELLRNMPLGILALGQVPASTNKRGLGELDRPVEMLDVVVKPGDWLYADENGVLVSANSLMYSNGSL
ncbi:putative 4-hydroxy-4-methyl-2-oxoglutarate aldolase [Catenovulum sp. SX2]|uniref:putative 4-hydroxy-4-methyl-2-oxoglutarate aldolase n=1 Tax=Catenovulum sp. SX2 TaxID=3398614 RepID=UPI003F873C8C